MAAAPSAYWELDLVFETGGLCIAHFSHLHHLLQPADLNTLGHIDIVMVAVDGE